MNVHINGKPVKGTEVRVIFPNQTAAVPKLDGLVKSNCELHIFITEEGMFLEVVYEGDVIRNSEVDLDELVGYDNHDAEWHNYYKCPSCGFIFENDSDGKGTLRCPLCNTVTPPNKSVPNQRD